MKVEKYLILHSGDAIFLGSNYSVVNLEEYQAYCNANMHNKICHLSKDLIETASHIECVLSHKVIK